MSHNFHLPLRARVGKAAAAALRLLPAELAHDLTIKALSFGAAQALLPGPGLDGKLWDFGVDLDTSLPGLGRLAHPLGLAAGMDKNACAAGAWQNLGFSFFEIGTVTPLAQPGNPKPRLFRLPDQLAIINRMGFNNEGVAVAAERLKGSPLAVRGIPVGINLGKNKDTPPEKALEDYRLGFTAVAASGEYFVVNVSSPNTPGLRALATPEFIGELALLFGAAVGKTWVKLDPDSGKEVFQKNIEAVARAGYAGVVLTNTHRVEWPEAGGFSGHSLLSMANASLEWAHEVHRGGLGMIGCGGVLDGADALQKVMRGASAVQIYTGLVYRGPWAVWEILREMAAELKLRGFRSLSEAKGAFYQNAANFNK